MNERECNGWSNYPTWVAKLWIDNDEGTANEVNDLIKATPSDYEASKLLQSYMEDPAMDILEDAGVMSSLMSDLMSYAYGDVNWQEIVEAIRADMSEETTDEDIETAVSIGKRIAFEDDDPGHWDSNQSSF
jgi:hypothetical protein